MQTAAAKIISSGPVRCSRKLTRNGTVMVFPGQVTDPSMQIAWRKIWRTHFSINLKEALDLPRGARLQDYLLINEGDFVSVNEPIARRSDHKTRSLNALYSGRFLGVSSGNLIFEADSDDLETVYAGFPGTVTEIIQDRGAVVETVGAYAAGVWGNNKMGQGILLTLPDIAKDGIFNAQSLSMAMSGSVVFANTCYDALRQEEICRRLLRSLFLRKTILQAKTAYWLMSRSEAGSVFLTDITPERSVISLSCFRQKQLRTVMLIRPVTRSGSVLMLIQSSHSP